MASTGSAAGPAAALRDARAPARPVRARLRRPQAGGPPGPRARATRDGARGRGAPRDPLLPPRLPGLPRAARQGHPMLEAFDRVSDLRRHARALDNSDIAGTVLRDRFFAPLVRWLAWRCPGTASHGLEEARASGTARGLVAPPRGARRVARARRAPSTTPAPGSRSSSPPAETDAAWLAQGLFTRLLATWSSLRDALGRPRPDARPRARARYAVAHPGVPRLGAARPLAVVAAPSRPARPGGPVPAPAGLRANADARRRRARHRPGAGGDGHAPARPRRLLLRRSARRADRGLGRGPGVRCIGMLPERRLMLEALYVPHAQERRSDWLRADSALFGSAEIAYNVFDTFRGARRAGVRPLLATVRHLFGADAFTIDPYQLGEGNEEASSRAPGGSTRSSASGRGSGGAAAHAARGRGHGARPPLPQLARHAPALARHNLYYHDGPAAMTSSASSPSRTSGST